MSWKGFFKGMWKGAQIAADLASVFLTGVPMGSRTALVVNTLIGAIHYAEEHFPAGSGLDKFTFVMNLSLSTLEAATGRNVNNPETRALLAKCTNLYVQILNLIAELKTAVSDLNKAIEGVKEPAVPDAPEA